MACRGHAFSHLRHMRHFSGSMYARLFSTLTAPKAHSFSHFPQPMQAAAHAFTAAAPRSRFMHATYSLWSFGPRGRNSMMPRGHAFAQAPQAVHKFGSTSGSLVSGFIFIPPNAQASAQSPHPRHPYPQRVSPMPQAFMARHVGSPS